MKKFDLASVLSVTTGRLLGEIGIVYEILNYMTGDNLMTHQLPRASRQCESSLLEQFPQLSGINADEITPANWQEKLESYKEKYGNEFDVIPLSDYVGKNPIDEVIEMMNNKEAQEK